MNLLTEAKKRRELKQAELKNSGYKFSIPIDVNDLSINECNDLLSLGIGETTCIIIGNTSPDITRIA